MKGLENRFLINIDHHVSGRPFAHVNWIDPKAVATAEMVYRLAREAGVKISPEIATCLYTAVLTDTGSFMFEGTNEHTFALARELVLAGADPAHCARSVYFGHSTAKMRLLGAALSNLHREGPLAWIWVTSEQMERLGAKEEDCEGLVNYALSIQDVEVAAFFRELPDGRFRVSLRSKGQLNVAAVAEQFGGGGHACASGCSLDGPLVGRGGEDHGAASNQSLRTIALYGYFAAAADRFVCRRAPHSGRLCGPPDELDGLPQGWRTTSSMRSVPPFLPTLRFILFRSALSCWKWSGL